MSPPLFLSFFLLALSALLGLYRMVKGPDPLNRIIAFDLICISIVGIMCLYSIVQETSYFLEVVLAFSLLGFTSTLALIDSLFKKDSS